MCPKFLRVIEQAKQKDENVISMKYLGNLENINYILDYYVLIIKYFNYNTYLNFNCERKIPIWYYFNIFYSFSHYHSNSSHSNSG